MRVRSCKQKHCLAAASHLMIPRNPSKKREWKYCDVINVSLSSEHEKKSFWVAEQFRCYIYTFFLYFRYMSERAATAVRSLCVCWWLKIYFYYALHNATKKTRIHIRNEVAKHEVCLILDDVMMIALAVKSRRDACTRVCLSFQQLKSVLGSSASFHHPRTAGKFERKRMKIDRERKRAKGKAWQAIHPVFFEILQIVNGELMTFAP